jgi:hypothetical protein
VGAFIAMTLALASSPAPAPTSLATPFGSVGSLPAAVTGTPGVSAAGATGSVPVDPSLLSVLPARVAGLPLTPDPDTASRVAADPSHAGDLTALAVAVAVDAGSGDLAVASVVRVLPGVYSAAYFDDWRATFDAGACSQSGGTGQTTEATIAGHDTFIGHCLGGLVTYHVHLADGDRIVSISSVGTRQLGQLIVEGLR